MNKFPKKLIDKLTDRDKNFSRRKLPLPTNNIDFSSNDYLGFAQSQSIFDATHDYLITQNSTHNGSTGSRLLTGNHSLFETTETYIAQFHDAQSALLFNSGYDANLGFFSAVPQRNDFILYDELCHASIRDGIVMSHAKSYKFEHNNPENLSQLIQKYKTNTNEVYVVTESVFSMDGDTPTLSEIIQICAKYQCLFVVDEAHALGVFGKKGEGIIQNLNLHDGIFARIMTFGKGLGCHGAAILGSAILKEYLVNFARSFIYTTALSPHSVATILMAYQQLQSQPESIKKLRHNISFFNQTKQLLGVKPLFVKSNSAIQSAIFSGNKKVKEISKVLYQTGFDVKPIMSPTVPEGQERLRFCLHSYNTEQQISDVLQLLSTFVF